MEDRDYLLKYGDPRMSKYPLMENPKMVLTCTMVYFVTVKFILPSWMKDRQPYSLKILIMVYNVLLVVVSSWLFLKFGFLGWFTNYSWSCEPIDFDDDNSDSLSMVTVCWVFFMTKLVEFADTVFFVLRKKKNQVSKLHVFHHCVAPITVWYLVKYGPGGYNTIFPMANSFVHIWMYLYYGLAAMGTKVQKFLWWKKYITALQMAQFGFVFVCMARLLLFAPEYCNVSSFLIWLSLSEAAVFLALFLDFYFSNYKKNKKL